MSESKVDQSGSTAVWLIVVVCAVAVIPGIGFLAWIIGGPMLLAAFILSIVSLSRGNGGLFSLLTSAILAPLFVAFAPVISTIGLGLLEGFHLPGKKTAAPTPAPLMSGPTVEESKRKLVAIYPQIGKAGSPANLAYLAAVKRAQMDRPEIFAQPTWPLLGAETFALPSEPAPTPKQGDWMLKNYRNPLNQPAR